MSLAFSLLVTAPVKYRAPWPLRSVFVCLYVCASAGATEAATSGKAPYGQTFGPQPLFPRNN